MVQTLPPLLADPHPKWPQRLPAPGPREAHSTAAGAGRGLLHRLAVGGERYLDVAPGGVGVRANLVSGGDQLGGLVGILDPGQGDVERHGELEAALLGGVQADAAVDRDLAGVDALTACHDPQRALEAGGVANREQLPGIGRAGLTPPRRASPGSVQCPSLDRSGPSRPPVTVASAVYSALFMAFLSQGGD